MTAGQGPLPMPPSAGTRPASVCWCSKPPASVTLCTLRGIADVLGGPGARSSVIDSRRQSTPVTLVPGGPRSCPQQLPPHLRLRAFARPPLTRHLLELLGGSRRRTLSAPAGQLSRSVLVSPSVFCCAAPMSASAPPRSPAWQPAHGRALRPAGPSRPGPQDEGVFPSALVGRPWRAYWGAALPPGSLPESCCWPEPSPQAQPPRGQPPGAGGLAEPSPVPPQPGILPQCVAAAARSQECVSRPCAVASGDGCGHRPASRRHRGRPLRLCPGLRAPSGLSLCS